MTLNVDLPACTFHTLTYSHVLPHGANHRVWKLLPQNFPGPGHLSSCADPVVNWCSQAHLQSVLYTYDCKVKGQQLLRLQNYPSHLTDTLLRHWLSSWHTSIQAQGFSAGEWLMSEGISSHTSWSLSSILPGLGLCSETTPILRRMLCWWGLKSHYSPTALLLSTFLSDCGIDNS